MNTLPQARNADLIVQDAENELLLYDLTIHRAYCLNETAALVWQRCDGKTTFDELTEQTGFTRDLIMLTLDGLQKKNLLAEKIETGIPKDRQSRRKMLMTVGTAAMALPVILTIVAPAASQATSCIGNGLTATGTSSGAQGSVACQSNATNRCCSLSSSNFMFSVNPDGSFTCSVVCGSIIG